MSPSAGTLEMFCVSVFCSSPASAIALAAAEFDRRLGAPYRQRRDRDGRRRGDRHRHLAGRAQTG